MIGIFNSIPESVPTSAGSFRRIRVHIREGSVAGGGKHPTSMSVATTNLADRVTNPVQVAFSKIHDGLGLGECGPIMGASLAVISGRDPRNGNEPFVNQIFLLDTGGAGAAAADAWLTICHAGNSGMCFIDSVELDEPHFLVSRAAAGPGHGGPADGRGAGGVLRVRARGRRGLDVVYNVDGVRTAPRHPRRTAKAPIRNYLRGGDGELKELPGIAAIQLRPGETVVSYCAGGGERLSPTSGCPQA